MNILVLGSGGREHTFTYKIAQSEQCEKLYVAPGNAGTSEIAENIPLSVTDFEAVKQTVLEKDIHMVVVGPEDPLVEGIYDFFQQDSALKNVKVIGPSKKGALLEGSKERAKEFMAMYNIPTAAYESFTVKSVEAGKKFLETLKAPYVLKADGLAAGKGVLILDNLEEAKQELENMLTNEKFGEASKTVVIEEFLDGIELSVFVLTDGKNYKILPTAKDYKRIGEGDTGLNTGGMGAISPVPFANEELMQKIEDRIVKPTINGLQQENIEYKGFVFIGLIKVEDNPYVIEYNVRMGDPETEVVLPRIKTDLVALLDKVAEGKLDEASLEIDERAATTVMTVSGGYPEAYEKGKEITGIENIKDSIVFHAGTKEENGKVVTNGGRVIAITSFGEDYNKALKKSYQNVEKLHFDKMYYRKDLGKDLN
ncbi:MULTISPECIES: phosphoribosylamine--glycine ligase [Mesonia]|uniref:Phosphoribosylamine--glycine ligase n=1 Tax=Mesonia oceanica TaxID=2687242 RepID=A0AC61Y495_9FLAO|nr:MULTISPECIES: phosphoribosylamine--glycine ligase [Mesonia]MAN28508.1 phosphoribosylamine--glycine ligase [Mesonia sp.]MAQ41189.1 phosphoribosylamine--glycine ligase [Mesonia sp.]MBJ97287.1 phosphoribosylamine--glycine ligase [Flavobacteriaceae bacterium]VVU98762.1 Phosphoribosylamine--glycine ligase [Mesonia oceanica]|tara:strand:+ start:89052 stop:90326 length:1275 start_codon:yes stop_codon:yes gene_type:complete